MLKNIKLISVLLLICLLGLIVRFPKIGEGLPYFYNEDEAHHFNRVVDMAKNFEFNPHYFHKPSLHFYLRMPAVWGAFLYLKNQGQVKSMHEFITRDPYGVADYAFSASHSTVAKFNRALSVLLSLALILVTGFVAFEFYNSPTWAYLSALLCALSPALIDYSAVVGVDVLMALMVILSVLFALRFVRQSSNRELYLFALFAGLAVSSKYNAAPILGLPVALCFFRSPRLIKQGLIALGVSTLSFVAASPFLLLEFKNFIDQAGYEVWHYAVAGHEGHEAKPGIEQLIFYLKWFATDGVGVVALLMALGGFCLFLYKRSSCVLAFAFFPISYFLMMVMLKANFERNMLVLIPFIFIAALNPLVELGSHRKLRGFLCVALVLFALSQHLSHARKARPETDSRVAAAAWLRKENQPLSKVAVAGQLQFEPLLYRERGIKRVNQDLVHPFDLYLSGFDRIVYGPGDLADKSVLSKLTLVKHFDGVGVRDRIVVNPEVNVYEFPPLVKFQEALNSFLQEHPLPALSLDLRGAGCSRAGAKKKGPETYCWINRRLDSFKLTGFEGLILNLSAGDEVKLKFTVMSPWPKQTFTVSTGDWSESVLLNNSKLGEFVDYEFILPTKYLNSSQIFNTQLTRVQSPKIQRINSDRRALGVALRGVSLVKN